MKINFDENDLHLSENFIKKDKTFSYYEENIRQKLKNKISDTQEAILFFNKYKYVYKEKAKKNYSSKSLQYSYIYRDLIDSFPLVNKNKLKFHLIKNGIFPINILNFLIYLIASTTYLMLANFSNVDNFIIIVTLISIMLIYSLIGD